MIGFLQRTDGFLTGINKWIAYAATVFLAVLMLINVADIIAAKWFHWTFPGVLDLSEEMMVFMTLLPIAFVGKERGHINITILTDRMPRPGQVFARHVQYIVGILVMGFWTWRTFVQFMGSVEMGELKFGAPIPTWPGNLAVVVSFGMMTLMLLVSYIISLLAKGEGK